MEQRHPLLEELLDDEETSPEEELLDDEETSPEEELLEEEETRQTASLRQKPPVGVSQHSGGVLSFKQTRKGRRGSMQEGEQLSQE